MTSPNDTPDDAQPTPPSPEELKAAFNVFKKRLKTMRLDDESRLSHGAMTKGGASRIKAITPPNQYPRAVWDALVAQGKLREEGQGLYARADE